MLCFFCYLRRSCHDELQLIFRRFFVLAEIPEKIFAEILGLFSGLDKQDKSDCFPRQLGPGPLSSTTTNFALLYTGLVWLALALGARAVFLCKTVPSRSPSETQTVL